MIRRIFASALVAGLAAGAVASVLQNAFVVPVLLVAERYETGALVHPAYAPRDPVAAADAGHAHAEGSAPHDHGAGTSDGGASDGGASDGMARLAMTAATELVAFSAFGLFLVAGFALAARAGIRIGAAEGIAWGLAGFVAVQLAPGASLAPELPGSSAAPLGPRQVWWVICVAATAAGLATLAFARGPVRAAGLALLAFPHLLGAPGPTAYGGVAPPELAALFASRSLAIGAVCWAVLGYVAALIWVREAPATARPGLA